MDISVLNGIVSSEAFGSPFVGEPVGYLVVSQSLTKIELTTEQGDFADVGYGLDMVVRLNDAQADAFASVGYSVVKVEESVEV